jgi:Asp-tRNA(Asn)/Glu-tRNA(Gln) amidotransferase A subunit family amidase
MTPTAQVDAAIARLRDAQDTLNACTSIDEGAARRAADAARAPLGGMPIALKDLIDQAGLATTCGSAFLREPAAASALVVERLERAGAVIVGRAGLHEFAYGFSSENPWFGPIRNPWDPATSPGGSSGGSAVAVAAGLVPAAIGTDTGGSVRVPAALTGIFGLKVTHGRVPTRGVFPLATSLDSVGPLARDAATLGRVYRAMLGRADVDARPLSGRDRTAARGDRIDGLRIGIPSQWTGVAWLEPGVARAFAAASARLADLGARVESLDVPELVPWGMINQLVGPEAIRVHRRFRAEGKPYGPDVAERLDGAEQVSAADYVEAHRWRAGLVESFAAAFDQVDLLLTPGVAARRKLIGHDLIGGEHYRLVLSWFSSLVNHAGAPALAMPLASIDDGSPPPSIQLIAPWWQEELLLDTATRLEAAGVVSFRRPPIYLD